MPGLLARPASGTRVRTRSPPRDATPGPTRAYTNVCEKLVCTYAPQPEVQKPPLPRSKLQKGYGEHSPRALRSESPPRSSKEAAGLAEMRGQARGRQVRGFRAPSCPPWVLSSRFHSPLGGSGPAWSSCPAQGAGHRRERVRSTPAPLPATWAQPSLIVTNLSAPSSLIGPIAARGNYLCTRLVGAPAAPPGAEERVARRLRAGVVERVGQRTASWRPDRPRSLLLSPRPSRARGAEFRVFLFLKRPGVVREEEENAPNTAWNVTRNIADPKSRIIPFSFCFSCSMRPTSFLHFQL